MAVPAFAPVRRSAARAAAAPPVQQSIDISYPPSPQQQTHRTLLQLATGINGRMNTRPLHRLCCKHYAGSANNNNHRRRHHHHCLQRTQNVPMQSLSAIFHKMSQNRTSQTLSTLL